MDPITALSVLGSIASIVSLLNQRGEKPDPEEITDEIAPRPKRQILTERVERKFAVNASVQPPSRDEVLSLTKAVISAAEFDQDFLERMENRCLAPYKAAIRDHDLDEYELQEQLETARRCICENLAIMRKSAGRKPIPPEMRALAEQFNCLVFG